MNRGGINWVIVEVDSKLINEVSLGSKKIFKDPTFDIYRNTRIKATVIEATDRVSGTVLYEKSIGYPYVVRGDSSTGIRYPLNFSPEMVTSEGLKPEVVIGDTIYFHYLSLQESNYMGRRGDKEIYKVGYEQIFCLIREGEIKMLNGYIAVQAYWDNSYEEVSFPEISVSGHKTGSIRTLKVKQSSSGVIYDINDKPLYRTGVVAHKSDAPDNVSYDFSPGNRIIYSDFSEFKNVIEGKEYYIMKLWDVVAVYKEKTLVPIRDYVIVEATALRPSLLIVPPKYKKESDEGLVVSVGSSVDDVDIGNTVKFGLENVMYVDLDGMKVAFMPVTNIYMVKLPNE